MACSALEKQNFCLFYLAGSRPPPPVSLHKREKKKKKKKESFETYSRISTLLVGRNVTTQAPSGSSNTNNGNTKSKNSRTQRQNKFAIFNIKQQIVEFF